MFGVKRTVMCAEQPVFEPCGNTVNARQWLMSLHRGTEYYVLILNESFVGQRSVNL